MGLPVGAWVCAEPEGGYGSVPVRLEGQVLGGASAFAVWPGGREYHGGSVASAVGL